MTGRGCALARMPLLSACNAGAKLAPPTDSTMSSKAWVRRVCRAPLTSSFPSPPNRCESDESGRGGKAGDDTESAGGVRKEENGRQFDTRATALDIRRADAAMRGAADRRCPRFPVFAQRRQGAEETTLSAVASQVAPAPAPAPVPRIETRIETVTCSR